ncbi:Eco57I restriction-modification methylase domain-containing protein [Mesobacillus maritimus]|uniref:Eco57I restriction-modification methylase domain-containing protein n=1 Tax=Mesobacillus maritimus TaxID=1643336 RepID=UPI0038514E5E
MERNQSLLFDPRVIKSELDNYQIENLDTKINIVKNWYRNRELINRLSEKELQTQFLSEIFGNVLGYSTVTAGNEKWTMEIEKSTDLDATTPDAVMGSYEKNERITLGIVELKGPKIRLDYNQKRGNKNYGTPVDQGFLYATKYEGCKWIIISNINEIRLYQYGRSQVEYERFILSELSEDEQEFKRFHYILNKDNLLSINNKSKIEKLGENRYKEQKKITLEFYKLYSDTRKVLWKRLIENNSSHEPKLLLEKSQKILDRIIFIRFCEDLRLLPPDILKSYIEEGQSAERVNIWTYLQTLFRNIDRGNSEFNINKFNGELFKHDPDLDYLNVPNDVFEQLKNFFSYNFTTDLDVNILGHIFEQSISEIEQLKEEENNTGIRKKEGIFYTPDYITDYIVRHSIGTWLEKKKQDLGFSELPVWTEAKSKNWRTIHLQTHIDFWMNYKHVLEGIKVLDPACGSGAFLNKAFDYLYKENIDVNKTIRQYELIIRDEPLEEVVEQAELLDIDKTILKNNIFGVDLNKESVEITKLSLWIKTANSHDTLTSLDKNILVGNSVIEEKSLGGDVAFNWNEQFKAIMDNGGFDIIIGNPPYVPMEYIKEDQRSYFQKKYKNYLTSKWELSTVFMVRCSELINKDGLVSLIVPVTWQTGPNYINFRNILFQKDLSLERLVNLPFNIFPDAYVDTCIFVASKNKDTKTYLGYKFNKREKLDRIKLLDVKMDSVSVEHFKKHHIKKIFASNEAYNLYFKIEKQLKDEINFQKLGNITFSTQGPVASKFKYYDIKEHDFCFPFLKDGQVYRYSDVMNEINFIDLEDSQNLIKYYIGNPKIFIRRIVNRQDRLMAMIVERDLVTKKDINPFVVDDARFLPIYVLTLINSKLLSYIYINFSSIATKDDYRQTTLKEVRDLPIRLIKKEEQLLIANKAKELISKSKQFENDKNKALLLLKNEFKLKKISTKIQEFYEHTFETMVDELKSYKIHLNLNQKSELYDYYIKEKLKLSELKNVILHLDKEIDQEIYNLYDLKDEEAQVIEEYYEQYNNPSSLF